VLSDVHPFQGGRNKTMDLGLINSALGGDFDSQVKDSKIREEISFFSSFDIKEIRSEGNEKEEETFEEGSNPCHFTGQGPFSIKDIRVNLDANK
jgi:hypothetical protein